MIITKLHTSYFILTVSSKPTDLGRPRAPLYLLNYSSGPCRRKRERFTSIFLSVSLSEFKTICHFDHSSFAQGQLSPISHLHQSIQNDRGDVLGQYLTFTFVFFSTFFLQLRNTWAMYEQVNMHLLAWHYEPFPAYRKPHPVKTQKHTCCGFSQALLVHPHCPPQTLRLKMDLRKISSLVFSASQSKLPEIVSGLSFNFAQYYQCDENEEKDSPFCQMQVCTYVNTAPKSHANWNRASQESQNKTSETVNDAAIVPK